MRKFQELRTLLLFVALVTQASSGRLAPLLQKLRHHEVARVSDVVKGGLQSHPSSDATHPSALSFKLQAFELEFHLELEKNADLFSENYTHRYSLPDGGWREERVVDHCYYYGKVNGDPKGVAAISTCNGIKGLIVGHGEQLHIEPAEPHRRHLLEHENEDLTFQFTDVADAIKGDHIIFRASDLQEHTSCGVIEDDDGGHDDHGNDHNHKHDHEHHQDHGHNKHMQDDVFSKTLKAVHGLIPNSSPAKDQVKSTSGWVGERRKLLEGGTHHPPPLWVELFIVNDSNRYKQKNHPGYSSTEDIVHQMDSLFRMGHFLPAIRVRLVAQETWAAGDKIEYPPNPQNPKEVFSMKLLNHFSDYRVKNRASLPPHDNAQLYSGVDFDGGASGMAGLSTMCHHSRSDSVLQITHTLALNAAVTAHEMGHNFGMRHDSDKNTCPKSGFIMNAVMSATTAPDRWSSCSREYIDEFFLRNHDSIEGCLESDPPARGQSRPDVCGDGILGQGEDCDCGQADCTNLDPCCNGRTCRFNPGAECSEGENFPCCKQCKVIKKSERKVCRASRSTCDIEEYCDGESQYCGEDQVFHPGDPCYYTTSSNQLVPGRCYDGDCMTHAGVCEMRGYDQPCTDPLKALRQSSDSSWSECGHLWCVMGSACGRIASGEDRMPLTQATGVPCEGFDSGKQCFNERCVPSSELPGSGCPDIATPQDAIGTVCKGKKHGDSCSFACTKGYTETAGSNIIKCVGSSWSDKPIVCKPAGCQALTKPANSVLMGDCEGVLGQTCKFECLPGFVAAEGTSTSRTCTRYGNWSGTPLVCRDKICPILAPGEKVEGPVCAGATQFDVCDFKCAEGAIRLSGTSSRMCLNGEWTGKDLACVQQLCPSLVPGPFSEGNECHNKTIGDECTFTCKSGFIPTEGLANRRCVNGTWTGEPLECGPISCPVLRPPPNSRGLPCVGAIDGEECSFKCSPGFVEHGSPTRTCKDAQWSGTPFRCVGAIKCPSLLPPDNAEGPACINLGHRDKCVHKCKAGYVRSTGDSSRVCYAGQWAGQPLSCVHNLCPDLAPPPGAEGPVCSHAIHMETCQFRCPSGYEAIRGQQPLTCVDGVWEGEMVVCAPLGCPPLKVPPNAAGLPCGDKKHGETCSFSCRDSYREIGGDSDRLCISGRWTGKELECVRSECPPLVPSSSQQLEGDACVGKMQWEVCTMRCKEGLMKVGGDSTRFCMNGEWTGSDLQCTSSPYDVCTTLSPPANAFGERCTNTLVGDTCTFQCLDGYNSEGDLRRTCTSNGWDGSPLRCEKKFCQRLSAPAGAYGAACEGKAHGDTCMFQCSSPDYEVVGDLVRVCALGMWTGNELRCAPKLCPEYPSPDNVVGPSCQGKAEGDTCEFDCAPGYVIDRASSLSCRDGAWAGSPISCSPQTCPDIYPPDNANGLECTRKTTGEECKMTCKDGYGHSGDSIRTCTNGQWSGQPLSCKPLICPDLYPEAGMQGSPCTGLTHGEVCSFLCGSTSTKVGGSIYRTCINGAWTGQPLKCSGLDDAVKSERSCIELGWPSKFAGSDKVCASSIIDGQCVMTDFENARSACRRLSARLCTKEELAADEAMGSGCSFDEMRVWTSSTAPCPEGAVVTQAGASAALSRFSPRCQMTNAAQLAVRCCADEREESSCDDGIRNGRESDVDCGGSCSKCLAGDMCRQDDDCQSSYCNHGVCMECPLLLSPRNTVGRTCAGVAVGQSCNFECGEGFQRVSGDARRTCQGIVWTGSDLICMPQTCPTLEPSNGATGTTCRMIHQQTCTFSCPEGLVPSGGDASRTCLNGKWSGSPLQCVPQVCPTLTPGTNVEGSLCQYKVHGTTCHFGCKSGMRRVSGTSIRNCFSGAWTGSPLVCAPSSCGQIRGQNAYMPNEYLTACAGTSEGSVCHLKCAIGYQRISGDSIRVCTAGQWTGEPLMCELQTCPSLEPPEYAQGAKCTNMRQGEYCEFRCGLGSMQLSGNPRRLCDQGRWSGAPLVCSSSSQQVCPDLERPANSIGLSCTGKNHGELCSFNCMNGYEPVGDTTRICLSGTWRGETLRCTQSVCPPLIPAQTAEGPRCSGMRGETCEHTCKSGYQRIVGDALRVCSSGGWSGHDLECTITAKRSCVPLRRPAHALGASSCLSSHGSTCKYTCEPGYTVALGDESRECNDGVWSGKLLVCVRKVCPDLIPPINADGSACMGNTDGMKCRFQCAAGLLQRGAAERTCQGNQWTGSPLVCGESFCPQLDPPEGVSMEPCRDKIQGDVCEFRCSDGYTRKRGSSARVCNSGQWSGVPLECEPRECPPLYPPLNAESTNDACIGKVQGGTCRHRCLDGFRAIGGDEVRTCKRGTWQGSQLICSRINCPYLPVPPNAKGEACRNKRAGESCQHTCLTGFDQIRGSAVRTCLYGKWSDSALVCQQQLCPTISISLGGKKQSCAGKSHGDTCSLMCPEGYERTSGSFSRTCLSGAWTGEDLVCSPMACRTIMPPPNAEGEACAGKTLGESCTFQCAPGDIEIAGNRTRHCINGFWNGLPLICAKPGCPAIHFGPNVRLVSDDTLNDMNNRTQDSSDQPKSCTGDGDGRQCEFACAEGYEMISGDFIRTCWDGIWTGTELMCAPKDYRPYKISMQIAYRADDIPDLLAEGTSLHNDFVERFVEDICYGLDLVCKPYEANNQSTAGHELAFSHSRALLALGTGAEADSLGRQVFHERFSVQSSYWFSSPEQEEFPTLNQTALEEDTDNYNRVKFLDIAQGQTSANDWDTYVEVSFQLLTGVPRNTDYLSPKELDSQLRTMLRDRSSKLYAGEITSRLNPNFYRSSVIGSKNPWEIKEEWVDWIYVGGIAYTLLMVTFLGLICDSQLKARDKGTCIRSCGFLFVIGSVSGVAYAATKLYQVIYGSELQLIHLLNIFAPVATGLLLLIIWSGVYTCCMLSKTAKLHAQTRAVLNARSHYGINSELDLYPEQSYRYADENKGRDRKHRFKTPSKAPKTPGSKYMAAAAEDPIVETPKHIEHVQMSKFPARINTMESVVLVPESELGTLPGALRTLERDNSVVKAKDELELTTPFPLTPSMLPVTPDWRKNSPKSKKKRNTPFSKKEKRNKGKERKHDTADNLEGQLRFVYNSDVSNVENENMPVLANLDDTLDSILSGHLVDPDLRGGSERSAPFSSRTPVRHEQRGGDTLRKIRDIKNKMRQISTPKSRHYR